MRRLCYTLMVLAGMSLTTGTEVQAQSLDFSSSLDALCIGTDCSQIQFTLDVVGDVFLQDFSLFSDDASLWKFGGLASVLDASLTDVTGSFFSGVSGDQLWLSASSLFSLTEEPLLITVDMATWATSSQLYPHITYVANGFESDISGPAGGPGGFYSTSGTVTPEPATILLLATGLAGVAVVGRRRREDEIDGLD